MPNRNLLELSLPFLVLAGIGVSPRAQAQSFLAERNADFGARNYTNSVGPGVPGNDPMGFFHWRSREIELVLDSSAQPYSMQVSAAASAWAAISDFTFIIRSTSSDPHAPLEDRDQPFGPIDPTDTSWKPRNSIIIGSTAAFGAPLAVTSHVIEAGTNEINEADILISPADGSGNALSPLEIQALVLHELGHLLGLGHASNGTCQPPSSNNDQHVEEDPAEEGNACLLSLPVMARGHFNVQLKAEDILGLETSTLRYPWYQPESQSIVRIRRRHSHPASLGPDLQLWAQVPTAPPGSGISHAADITKATADAYCRLLDFAEASSYQTGCAPASQEYARINPVDSSWEVVRAMPIPGCYEVISSVACNPSHDRSSDPHRGCVGGWAACDGPFCTTDLTDPSQCGACGAAPCEHPTTACDPMTLQCVCEDPTCGCGPGLEWCGGQCVQPSGQPGLCGCPPGYTDCGGNCVSLSLDQNHCGQCGNACPTGTVCDAARCR